MRKLWLDVETTGLDATKNGIIQLACIDDKTGDTFQMNMLPYRGCFYTKEAENVHGKSEKVISKYTPEDEAVLDFIEWLEKLKGNDKFQFQIAGYNSRFDMDFVTELFKRNKVRFWNYFNYYDIDVFALVKILDLSGTFEGKTSKKLGAICKIDNAHDAMSDIKATRKLYKKLVKKYFK